MSNNIIFDSTRYDDDEELTDQDKADYVSADWDNLLSQADKFNGTAVVNGAFSRWDGCHSLAQNIYRFNSLREALEHCQPDCEASITIEDDPISGLTWRQSDHDSPMGGTCLVISLLNNDGSLTAVHLQ